MQPSRREETGSTSCNVVPVKQIPRPLRAQQPGSMNGPVERVHLRKCSRGSQQRDADALANGPNMRQQSCVDPLRARTLSLVMFFFHLGSLSLTVRGMLTHTCGTRRSSPGRRLLPVGCSTGDPGKHGTGCNCNPPPAPYQPSHSSHKEQSRAAMDDGRHTELLMHESTHLHQSSPYVGESLLVVLQLALK